MRYLKIKNNVPIDDQSRVQGFEKVKSKTRRFHKRKTYQKWKKKESLKKVSSLVFNLSDFPIIGPMESLLNRGLSFVPIPKKLNITQLKTDLDRYTRTMLWKEFWFENDEDTTQSSTQNTSRFLHRIPRSTAGWKKN